MSRSLRKLLLALLLGLAGLSRPCQAHPVPRRTHDRTIVVHLGCTPDGQVAVQVDYRLEVDEFTVVFDDLPALDYKADLSKLRKPDEFYDTYTRCYAPIFAANLLATVDGRPLVFQPLTRNHRLQDEKGVPLGHLRCDFVFQAQLQLSEATPGTEHRFTFREGNFELEEGFIRLSLQEQGPIALQHKTVPGAALQARPATELQPGDDAKLRKVSATLTLPTPDKVGTATYQASSGSAAATSAPSPTAGQSGSTLLTLLLDTRQGMVVLLLLAAVFGAAHALTPGHGKTLVAAYLVGEKGTMTHALILGLVTTLTHTGAVLALAALLLFFFPQAVPQDVQMILGLVGGLLVAGLGFWLLLRRLSGGADHIHLGGHGHYHHHHHHHHDHVHLPRAAQQAVSWWGLIVLGISGGIVPCWDAIIMLGFAISAQRLWLGVPLLLAFSAGLASVLILIGIGVVYFKGFASSRWGQGRIVQVLPLISAMIVTGLGIWLCYDSLHAPRRR
jgi:ABC-type nickel/cobalt efflux system permease component RcnA